MDFTREPIIETIISPREGHKLLVRSSKSGGPAEEYYVDALEVVSFGRAFFFRSMERPKAFLVPASDYEVLEVKETRAALKAVSHDRNIKIAGGRETSFKPPYRESVEKESEQPASEEEPSEKSLETAVNSRMEKRRDRRRRRHRRSEEGWTERKSSETQPQTDEEAQGGSAEDEAKASSSTFSSLIPPPSTLISETISRYKDKEPAEETPPPEKELEEKKEKPKKEHPKEEDEPGSDSAPLHRMANPVENLEESPSTSAHFSYLKIDQDSFFF